MATDIPDWTRLIDLVPMVMPGQDFPDWTVGVQAPTGSPLNGPFLAVGETLPIPVHVKNLSPSSGNWAVSVAPGTTPIVTLQNVTPAINDFFTLHFPAPAGTYSLLGIILKDVNKGIQTFSVDGSVVGTVDGYAASSGFNGEDIDNIVISTSGDHTLEVQILGKNGSSTNYGATIYYMNLQRTA